ncbi:prolyl 4-hydroxylase subunit alpha-2-like [Mizuhopecten yessoensis]|uniref:Prolyl 4-hydroxylase subunit alpha-2 n=1 Tax=Mizuhopecten yessoensis TaxID=6573 RepID=A0A210QRE5_MIZYE|nr:prolyl 4-hydroxylase subunit alpha-2-like [Mizuhopecten yessoensis]OWF51289.1 Prolyl 4-hydroxylase subunit alpha-2 [Mizuhopecten yessoensis]
MMFLLNVISILVLIHNVQGSDLFSYINLEKYYFIEEELIGLAGAIVEIERKGHSETDVHTIFHHSRIIQHAKRIHMDAGNYEEYLAHPINVFHLTKRLATEWRNTTTSLLESSLCVNDLKVKLMDIEDNLPTEMDFNNITYAVLGLQDFHRYSNADVMEGSVNGVQSYEPVTTEDAVDFGMSAFKHNYPDRAISWLEYVIDKIGSSTTAVGKHSVGMLYSTLATVYLRNNKIDMALETTDRLLKLVPDSTVARQNKEYFQMKKSRADKTKEQRIKVSKFTRLRDGLCSGTISMAKKKSKRRTVRLDTWDESFLTRKIDIDAMVIRQRPLIVVIPGLISNEATANITTLGYDKMFQKAIPTNKYGDPKFKVRVNDTSGPYTVAVQDDISQIKLTRYPPQDTMFEVLNIGMDGIHRTAKKKWFGQSFSGTMLTSLSDATLGGEVVFPLTRTILRLQKGDVLFYEAGASMSICPVMYGSQWYGTMGVWESLPNGVCGLKHRVITV